MKPCDHRCKHSRRSGMLQFEARKVKSALSPDGQHCRNSLANLTQQLLMTGANNSLSTGWPHQITQSALLRTLGASWLMYGVPFQLGRYPPGELTVYVCSRAFEEDTEWLTLNIKSREPTNYLLSTPTSSHGQCTYTAAYPTQR